MARPKKEEKQSNLFVPETDEQKMKRIFTPAQQEILFKSCVKVSIDTFNNQHYIIVGEIINGVDKQTAVDAICFLKLHDEFAQTKLTKRVEVFANMYFDPFQNEKHAYDEQA